MEAQANMTYSEFVAWCKYRQRYGSLHPGMRLDRAVSRVGAFFGNMLSGKRNLEPDDFSPFDKADAARAKASPGSIEEVFVLLADKARK